MTKTKRKHRAGGAVKRGAPAPSLPPLPPSKDARAPTRAYLESALKRWMQAHEAAAHAHAAAAAQLAAVQAERDELAALLRRAVGVISDVERTRGEAAAVLDAYAATRPRA